MIGSLRDDQLEDVRELFEAASELPRERWADFLASSSDDPEVCREVQDLLDADLGAGEFLETGPGISEESLADLAALSKELPEGARLGSYRLLSPLGQGGMSTVYLAVRADDTYRRRVAIKVLSLRLAARDARRRFETERQILASLEHPYIARLYDGGATDNGVPYLVMEHVEGVHLDQYCDQQGLPLGRRIALFLRACEAVHYAHQNLIVHRDLKPSNILVTRTGVPKLLDFGIAKLLNPDLVPMDLAPTATWARVLTPQYASPEQVRGIPVTTATDVYSLGVLLFELLTGQRPFRWEGMTPSAIERTLQEQTAPAPSSMVLANRGEWEEKKPKRFSTGLRPSQLARELEGDLDNIVLKALRQEPGRRYGSVQELGEDLRRYLKGLPVRARPLTVGYRLRKYLSRNRWPVAAASLFLLSLLGFAVISVLQGRRIAEERDQARQEAEKSERVLTLMQEIFQEADPAQARGKPLTLEEALDRGAGVVERLDDSPEVRARLLGVLGEIYGNSGFYPRAEELLRQADQAWRDLAGPGSPAAAASRDDLAKVLRLRGQAEEAERLGREALEIQMSLLGLEHPDTLETAQNLILALTELGRLEEAEALARESAPMRRKVFGDGILGEFDNLQNLAGLRHMAGDSQTARQLQEQAVELGLELLGEDHPRVLMAFNNLAVFLETTGELEEAAQMHRKALALHRKVLGDDHPDVALSLQNLASVLIRRGSPEEAEAALEEALAIQHRSLGPDHPDLGTSYNNLGFFHLSRGRLGEAEDFLQRAVDLRRRVLGEDHPKLAVSLYNLATALHDQGRLEEAQAGHEEALALRLRVLGPDHPDVALSRFGLAKLARDLGHFDEAEQAFRRALERLEVTFGEEHPRTAAVQSGLGELLVATGRAAEAEPVLRQSRRSFESALGADHVMTAISAGRLGESLLRQGRGLEAKKLLSSSYDGILRQYGPGHPESEQAGRRLAALDP